MLVSLIPDILLKDLFWFVHFVLLLWQKVEYEVGCHDWHPVVTGNEQIDKQGKIGSQHDIA